jgi:hypothetical protein
VPHRWLLLANLQGRVWHTGAFAAGNTDATGPHLLMRQCHNFTSRVVDSTVVDSTVETRYPRMGTKRYAPTDAEQAFWTDSGR